VQHGKAGGVGLDGKSGLDELQRTDAVGKVRAMRATTCADIGAAAEPPRHESSPLELIQRAPHRASRSIEGEGKLTFWRQPVAFAVGAGLDGAPEIGGNRADALSALLRLRRKPLLYCSRSMFHQRFAFSDRPTLGPINKLVYIGF
jgi:hypothetical protein